MGCLLYKARYHTVIFGNNEGKGLGDVSGEKASAFVGFILFEHCRPGRGIVSWEKISESSLPGLDNDS